MQIEMPYASPFSTPSSKPIVRISLYNQKTTYSKYLLGKEESDTLFYR